MGFFARGPRVVVCVRGRQGQYRTVAQIGIAIQRNARRIAFNEHQAHRVGESRAAGVVVDEDGVVTAFGHVNAHGLRIGGPVVGRKTCRSRQRHRFPGTELHGRGRDGHIHGARHFKDGVVLIDFRVVNHRLHTAGPLDDGLINARRCSQAKMAREGAGDAVALSSADFADLGAEVSCQNHLRSHRVHVGLKSFKLEGDPMVIVAVVHPKHVRIAVVRADVAVSVARVHVDLTVPIEVPKREAVHRVVVGERIGHVGEGLVSVVVVVPVRPPRVDEVDKTVVVEVLHFGLQEESRDFETTAGRDVVEVAVAVVLHEVQRRAVVSDEAIEVTVVVDVCKVHRPALLIKDEAARQRFFCPAAVAVIHPELVDTTGILGVVDKLAALGNEQIEVTVVVEITPHRAVIAAVVCVGVRAVVVVRQINECRRGRQTSLRFLHLATCG